ncbi:class I SAM-dependent methyltransferase [Halosolutus gelatinilyticus]|uniref:class I SAM-dependent methyltransferase n=1 Tax=Halosolutus gelatinilyticus TaxID=2931975 RepID=UPI001FF37956|nr:class I SAM-dependent methyltransferase [Halosolutus gelatinilyticus]
MTTEHRSRGELSGEPALPPDRETTLAEAVADRLPNGRALDIATGDGRVAIELADRGWTVDAVDISRAKLDRARERAAGRSASVEWILADVDGYCFPESAYDVVSIRFFDARDRLPDVKGALAPGGALVYEHHLQPSDERDPRNPYRFESNELLEACAELSVRYYAEDPDRARVWLVASNESASEREG